MCSEKKIICTVLLIFFLSTPQCFQFIVIIISLHELLSLKSVPFVRRKWLWSVYFSYCFTSRRPSWISRLSVQKHQSYFSIKSAISLCKVSRGTEPKDRQCCLKAQSFWKVVQEEETLPENIYNIYIFFVFGKYVILFCFQ